MQPGRRQLTQSSTQNENLDAAETGWESIKKKSSNISGKISYDNKTEQYSLHRWKPLL
ncbi:MAG: hypothetical protein BWX73_01663 [Lentisphaerae bacterium ADurb.Bin082]|nr:MAG: hypothetical protein BWX73_01663 [Lentisphaerae bacterium ADurb.Bin082]